MSFPLWKRRLGQLAQLVEHRPYKAGATGSSPVLPTKKNQNHPLVRVVFLLYIHNNLKNNKKREYSTYPLFIFIGGGPLPSSTAISWEWARDHARFRGRLGGGVSGQHDAMPSEMFRLACGGSPAAWLSPVLPGRHGQGWLFSSGRCAAIRFRQLPWPVAPWQRCGPECGRSPVVQKDGEQVSAI